MGTACAWCETTLHGGGTSERRISHAICGGCLEELRTTLQSAGLRLAENSAGGQAEGRTAPRSGRRPGGGPDRALARPAAA